LENSGDANTNSGWLVGRCRIFVNIRTYGGIWVCVRKRRDDIGEPRYVCSRDPQELKQRSMRAKGGKEGTQEQEEKRDGER